MKNVLKSFTDTDIRFNCRFSYAHVFEPTDTPSGDKKYSVCLLIPKSDKETVDALGKAIDAAKENGKTNKFGGKIPSTLKIILRDGDADHPDDESYQGMLFLNASSKKRPGVKMLEAGALVDCLDEEDFYSGCYGAAEINFFAYNSNGSKGISAGLNNVIKLEDGEKLSGGHSADEAFSDLA